MPFGSTASTSHGMPNKRQRDSSSSSSSSSFCSMGALVQMIVMLLITAAIWFYVHDSHSTSSESGGGPHQPLKQPPPLTLHPSKPLVKLSSPEVVETAVAKPAPSVGSARLALLEDSKGPQWAVGSPTSHQHCAFSTEAERVPSKDLEIPEYNRVYDWAAMTPDLRTPPQPSYHPGTGKCAVSLYPTESLNRSVETSAKVEWHFSSSEMRLRRYPSSIGGAESANSKTQSRDSTQWLLSLPPNITAEEFEQLEKRIKQIKHDPEHSAGGYFIFPVQLNTTDLEPVRGPTYVCVTLANGTLVAAHLFLHRVWTPKFINHSAVTMMVTAGDTRWDLVGDAYGIVWNWRTGQMDTTKLHAATHDAEFDPISNTWLTIQRRVHGPGYCQKHGFIIHPNQSYHMECYGYNFTVEIPLWVDTLAEIDYHGRILWEWNPMLLFNTTRRCRDAFVASGDRGEIDTNINTCIRRWPAIFLPTLIMMGQKAWSRFMRRPLLRGRAYSFRDRLHKHAALDLLHGNTIMFGGLQNEYIYYHCAYLNSYFKLHRNTRKVVWSAGMFLGMRCQDTRGYFWESCTHHAHGIQMVGEDADGSELFVTFDNDARNLERLRLQIDKLFNIKGDIWKAPQFSRLLLFRVNPKKNILQEVGYWLRPNRDFLWDDPGLPYLSFNRMVGGGVVYLPNGNIQGSFMDHHVEFTPSGYIAALVRVKSGGFLHWSNRFFSYPVVHIIEKESSAVTRLGDVQVCIYDTAYMNVGQIATVTIASGKGCGHDLLIASKTLRLFSRWRPTCVILSGAYGVVNISVVVGTLTTTGLLQRPCTVGPEAFSSKTKTSIQTL